VPLEALALMRELMAAGRRRAPPGARPHELSLPSDTPADAVEQAFFRIQREQMADVPILNPALSVEAVDFQRWQGHWLGVVVTPWCMSLLLVPGSEQDWVWHGRQQRRFVQAFRPAISPSSAAARPSSASTRAARCFRRWTASPPSTKPA
jgi:hypothetical protein